MHRSVCCAGDGGRQSDVGTPEWPSVEQSSSAATKRKFCEELASPACINMDRSQKYTAEQINAKWCVQYMFI